MIALSAAQIDHIRRVGEAVYPDEGCGLLVGHDDGGGVVVTRIVDSPNINADRAHDRFEIDPKIRLDVERALRGGPERVVGHFHSHPDHPAEPSDTDLSMAYEPDLVWVIVSVAAGRAEAVRAFRLDERRSAFAEIAIERR